MKPLKALAVIFLLLASINNVHADKIRIIIKQPPPNLLGVANLWDLTLENTTGQDMKIYLIGTASEDKDGLIIEGKSKVFTIKPGRTSYKYNDFSNAEVKYNNGKYKEIILRTGNAPEGNYSICVTAYEESGEVAGMENCITQTVQQQGSIMLTSPSDGEEIDTEQPLLFTWAPLPKGGPYSLKIVELKGDQSPDVAIKNTHDVITVSTTSSSYMMRGGEHYPWPLPPKKKYAWQVSGGGVESEVYTFTVKNSENNITLISPANNEVLNGEKEVTFRWSPVIPIKPVKYRLRVWQLMEGQNGTSAMKDNQPLVTKEVEDVTEITITNLITGPCKPPYLCDFVWDVAVMNSGGFNNPQVENNGFSIVYNDIPSGHILFPDDATYVLDAKLNSKIHGREINTGTSLQIYDKELNDNDNIYVLEPSWAGANSKDTKASEKLNTNKVNADYLILKSSEGELYAMPLLVLYDYDPVLGFAEACSKCPTTYDNKRGCSGSFCFCLLSADSIAKPKPINFTVGTGGSGTEVIKILYTSQWESIGEVLVAFECNIPTKPVTFGKAKDWGGNRGWHCAHNRKSMNPNMTHPEIIIQTAGGSFVARSGKTGMMKKVSMEEEKILELAKAEIESKKISKDELLKSIRNYLETGETPSTAIGWPIECRKVPCDFTCGDLSCDGYWVCKWVGFR